MEQASCSYDAVTARITLIALPMEVLVYIISFLSIREKVGIRCVSKTLRCASEVPSLWEEFTWSCYAPRDGILLKSALKTFGKHIRIFHFADHIAPSKLQVMLKFCKNVIHLSLPSFKYKNVEELETVISSTANLQILSILEPKNCSILLIRQIFVLFSKLKELSLFLLDNKEVQDLLKEWADFNYVPRKLNIAFEGNAFIHLQLILRSLQSCVSTLRSKMLPTNIESGHSAWFNICFKRSMDFSPVVPAIQLRVTDSSVVLSSVRASKYGILGLDNDTLHLTEGSCYGKKVHKALLTGTNNEYIDTSVTSLSSVTYFDASHCKVLHPGHLEQLSIACPNLQKLDLWGNSKCLSNLQGLQSLANNCKSLYALNLWCVGMELGEVDHDYSCSQLWEVLSTMHLIQLAIEGWMIDVYDRRNYEEQQFGVSHDVVLANRRNLIRIFQDYASLKVLEVFYNPGGSLDLASYFPSITSYRLVECFPSNIFRISNRGFGDYHLKAILDHKYLRCVYLSVGLREVFSHCCNCSSLQQLYIDSLITVLEETFVDALCSHGGLEHVILSVKSLTAKSIDSIIEKSPNLITLYIFLNKEVFLNSELIPLIASIKTKFSKRRLFNGGNFDLKQVNYEYDHSLLNNTDLLSIWEVNNN